MTLDKMGGVILNIASIYPLYPRITDYIMKKILTKIKQM